MAHTLYLLMCPPTHELRLKASFQYNAGIVKRKFFFCYLWGDHVWGGHSDVFESYTLII